MCDDVGEGAKMQLVVTPEAPALLQYLSSSCSSLDHRLGGPLFFSGSKRVYFFQPPTDRWGRKQQTATNKCGTAHRSAKINLPCPPKLILRFYNTTNASWKCQRTCVVPITPRENGDLPVFRNFGQSPETGQKNDILASCRDTFSTTSI